VALKAKGVGSTLFCKDWAHNAAKTTTIDFNTEYTHQNIVKEFFLENRGQRAMKIQWVRTDKPNKKKKA
jgi:hypothetical protein